MRNEDNFTSTVDGAAAFERGRSWAEWYDDRPTNAELMRDEINEEAYRPSEDEDECNCSDPGCPCGGIKRGGV